MKSKTFLSLVSMAALFVTVSASAETTWRNSLPVLSVTQRRGRTIGTCTRVPLKVVRDDSDEPLQIAISDDTPGGSGAMMRSSVWTAALTAALAKESTLDGTFVTVSFKGNVDGPSAGAMMCLGIMSALDGRAFPSDFAMTGSILPDGTVGLVGGVQQKIRAAAKDPSIKRVAIPAFLRFEQDDDGTYVDLFRLGEEVGIRVIPVDSIEEAYRALHGLPRQSAVPVSSRDVCDIDREMEDYLKEKFVSIRSDLRGYYDGMDSNAWESLSSSYANTSWNLMPGRAERRYEEGSLFPAYAAIMRCYAGLRAYLRTEKLVDGWIGEYFEEHPTTADSYSDLPVQTNLVAFVRERVEGFCEIVLGWRNNDADRETEPEPDNESAPEPIYPHSGTSDAAAQMGFLGTLTEQEGTYHFMRLQTTPIEDIPELIAEERYSAGLAIEYERRKLFYLMQSRLNDTQNAEFLRRIKKLDANPDVRGVGKLFDSACRAIDGRLDADLSDTANRAEVHKSDVTRYYARNDLHYAIYESDRHWAQQVMNFVREEEESSEGGPLLQYNRALALFHNVDWFVNATAILLKYGGDVGFDKRRGNYENTTFLSYIINRAREQALRNMAECRAKGIPYPAAIQSFQEAEACRDEDGRDKVHFVLANYWKSAMTAKALVMAFRATEEHPATAVGYDNVLLVGVQDDALPYSDVTDTGEYEGVQVELVRRAAEKNGWIVRYETSTVKDLDANIVNGVLDLALGTWKDSEASTNVAEVAQRLFPDDEHVILARKGRKDLVKALDDELEAMRKSGELEELFQKQKERIEAERSDLDAAKSAMSAFLDLLLNAEAKPFLDSLPEDWTKSAADAAAVVAAKADDETWAMLQNLVKQGAALLILQSGMLADMAFDDAEDPSDSPLSKEDVQAVIENWGRRLLSLANAATRETVADGRLEEALTENKRRLKGREDAGRTFSLPEVSSRRRSDGAVEVSVPAWKNAETLAGLVDTEPDVFRPANGKMVAEDVIELFADSSFWKALAAEWADGILAEGPEDVRTTLSALTDLLRSALRASGPEEFNAIFEEFDWSILFGDDIAVEEVEDDAGAAFDAN